MKKKGGELVGMKHKKATPSAGFLEGKKGKSGRGVAYQALGIPVRGMAKERGVGVVVGVGKKKHNRNSNNAG